MKKLFLSLTLVVFTWLLVSCTIGTAGKYGITFQTNGGTTLNEVRFNVQFDVSSLKNYQTVKKGYNFAGWYTDEGLVNPVPESGSLNQSTVLYAKWNLTLYPIHYVLNDGVNHLDNPTDYTIESALNILSPTKTGHTFLGWYLEESFKTQVTNISQGKTGEITLYAKWDQSDVKYHTITWQDENEQVISTSSVLDGTLPVFERYTTH